MASGEFILKINSRYNLFTKAERKVADYVLQNPKKVLFMSITDLAEACDVGDTSVFRFCKTMQLQGYQEFKMQLSLSISDDDEDDRIASMLSSEITQEDSIEEVARKVLQINQNALNETFDLLNYEALSQAVDYMISAKQIYFFGVGSSLMTAQDAVNKFIRITSKIHSVPDAHMQAMAASVLTPDDLAFVISYSGATKDTIQVVRQAKQEGAKVVSITRFEKSPLTAYSDVVILCGTNEGPLQGGSTSARISQMMLLDLIYMEYFKRTYDVSSRNKKKTSGAVLEKLY
ncbi:MurR/RpiR family transcriptional regulator [Caproiciproducens galactitolivorans]|uniref:Putative HTH-type transcriptional regulator YbbH n=1 Tax=Caproiciproducens galactitolivorans TaxID=642589 RepID=A0A4Z0Y8I3_9FIRM|nr:MurR/RpiR family transcriptional regulator [Caproiciproducens galactitolivorans]QEY33634.1 MurR/RpiR family transcriptional regulator [Caproiciproducens galactitolivorans]TGJ76248.1 putative HTH-type transcriptional regulator YbbH [Caproiciproducens galactitolivorans]